ncbi:MAG: hypothetical protein WCJ37_14630 [Syntrophus sp. (in: bacteria)]
MPDRSFPWRSWLVAASDKDDLGVNVRLRRRRCSVHGHHANLRILMILQLQGGFPEVPAGYGEFIIDGV